MRMFIFSLMLLLLGSAGNCSAQMIVWLQPGPDEGEDTMVGIDPTYDRSDRNYGNNAQIQATAWTDQTLPVYTRALLKFNLSLFPSMENLTAAYLYLYNNPEGSFEGKHQALKTCSSSGCSVTRNDGLVRRVLEPWDEHTVTWNTQPTTSKEHEVTIPAPWTSNDDLTADVTGLVRDMYAVQPPENHGFMVRLKVEKIYAALVMASSDYWDETRRPKLELHFSSVTDNDVVAQPAEFEMSVYPNPARTGQNVTAFFALPTEEQVFLSLYDINGRHVATLAEGRYAPGRYTIPVSIGNLSAGVYVYRLIAGKHLQSGTMLLQ